MNDQLFDGLTPTMDLAHGRYRSSDPETSQGAAIIAIGNAATNRSRALLCLYRAGDDGLTDFELSAITGVAQTSIGVRRGELRDAGLVRRAAGECGNGVKRPSPSGTPSAVWILTAEGIMRAETVG